LNTSENNDAQVMLLDDWIVRVRPPQTAQNLHVFLLLHGLTGDEHSMTIFTRNLPRDAWILSPRAPIQTDKGGYKWINAEQGMVASFVEFREAANRLRTALQGWEKTLHLQASSLDVIGFSQGAVLAATYLLLFPHEISRLGFLSGFLPADTSQYIQSDSLSNKAVFIAHGSQDKTVPLAKAQQTATWLQTWGASVTFCEAAVGHRLSASCFRAFADFFKTRE
jgi:phospholipase/carboxylesterase